MKNKALLEAVDKAIEALEAVKRELEREENADCVDAAPIAEAPKPAPARQTEDHPARKADTTQRMEEAAKIAAQHCTQWKFQDEPGEPMDAAMLAYACREQDSAGPLDDDPDSWYIVSPDGAIGATEDAGRSVTWLFLPLGRSMSTLPKKLCADEPWPEKEITPAEPAQTVPAPSPAPSSTFASAPASASESVPKPVASPSASAQAPSAEPKTSENICPSCGKPYIPGTKFCMGCGTSLQAAPKPAPAAPKPAENVCPSCGKPYTPGTRFCMGCGASLQAAPAPAPAAPKPAENVCSSCGKPYTPGTKFCMGCGASLQAAPKPAPAAPKPVENVCPSCGKPYTPGTKFCMGCGTSLQAASTPAPAAPKGTVCTSCGAPLQPGDKFCMKCGARV